MSSQPLIIDPGSQVVGITRGPLIRPARVKWERDAEMSDLIDYFDAPRFHDKRIKSDADRFASLTVKEISIIEGIASKCRANFSYAARNFFWITNKKRGEQLFKLWESQELIYEHLLNLKAKGLMMKLMILKARQLGALDPDTKILRADSTWDRIDNICIGDELISVDEYAPGGKGASRKLRSATVIDKWEVEKECFRVNFDDASSIIATGDHKFLCRVRGNDTYEWRQVRAENKEKFKHGREMIKPGDQIRCAFEPWETAKTFEDGWFSGLLDGEGSYRDKVNGSIELCVCQVEGEVLDRAHRYLKNQGVKYRIEVDSRKPGESSKFGTKDVHKLVMAGSAESMRMIGRLRPARFIKRHPWEGKELANNGESNCKTVAFVESLGIRRMVDIRTSTSTFIAEGLITHNCSTLIEGLIAWKTMMFKNVNAIVVSFDAEHAAYLFGIMQYILDRMPWWLKPQCSSREYKDGLKFENPDQDDRRQNPGLNSAVMVQAANKRTGVGQGVRISAAHLSEYADWHPDYARDVIEEDLGNALAEDDPDMFAILESTAKGAGNYSYRLWNKNVELAEQAEWHPLFLPWFFERTRFIPPPNGWRVEQPEVAMSERVQVDWIRCSNEDCEQYQERYIKTEDRSESICPTCGTGVLKSYSLKPGQMYFMQRKRKNAEKEAESLKKLRQELSTTAEESFQLSGVAVFGEGAQDFVNNSIRPPLREGFLDKNGKFHGCNPKDVRRNSQSNEMYQACYLEGCDQDHNYGDENGEHPFHIWKDPERGAEYSIGADVSEGLGGEFDYSVGFVIKVNRAGGADEHVATFRSNRIDPVAFAQVLNFMGRWYNEAMMAIEVNRYDTCMSWIRFQLQYPNLYRWKHMDSINPLSNKLGWLTNVSSKPRLYQTMKRWLQFKLLLVYSRNFASEMKTFTKDEDERGATAESGAFDDEIMAAMIALYCAHEGDWDDSLGQMSVKRELTLDESPWHMSCNSCQLTWPARSNHEDKNCPRCKSMIITGKPNRDQANTAYQGDPFEDGRISRHEAQDYSVDVTQQHNQEEEPSYELL